MNRSTLIISILFLALGRLWGQAPTLEAPPKPARHTLMLRMGGSALGIGPSYEYLAIAQPKFGLGLYVGFSPLNMPVYRFSPFMETVGVAAMYGSKRWKAELDIEATHYFEKGVMYGDYPPYEIPYKINDFYGAALIGARRQSPWGGLFFKANVGPMVFANGSGLRAMPTGSLALGYTFGKTEWQRPMLLAGPAWRTRWALMASLDRHFEHATKDRFGGNQLTPDFGSGPAAQAGIMLDVSGSKSRWGMRFALSAAATHVHYNWGEYFSYFYIPRTFQHKTDIQGLGGNFNIRGRYAMGNERPWIIQAGWYVSMYALQRQQEWSESIPYWHDRYNRMPLSTGPLLAVSKQWPVGRWTLEPFVEGRMSVRDDIGKPDGRTRTLALGLIAWLPSKHSPEMP